MARLAAAAVAVFLVGFFMMDPIFASQDIDNEAECRERFEEFIQQHGKTFKNDAQKERRFQRFRARQNRITKHNKDFKNGRVSYTVDHNQFSDLTHEEMNQFKGIHPDFQVIKNEETITPDLPLQRKRVLLPASFDWRSKGAVTPVKYQAGALESYNFIKTKKLVPLSEQNLVDCVNSSYPYYCSGCDGGWPAGAIQYVKDIFKNNLDKQASYPYKTKNGKCSFVQSNNGFTAVITSIKSIATGDENTLKTVVATIGPVTAAIDASSDLFQSYSSGVFNYTGCGANVDHGVLIVGYGTDTKFGDYWIVKNSWGTSWGEKGYVRIARNRGNMCAIASYNYYPIIG